MATAATRREPRSKTPKNRPVASRNSRRRLFLERLEDRRLLAGQVFPDDPLFSSQWPLHNTGQSGGIADADIDAPEAWSVTTGSLATVVAVLDSGVDYTDPDLYLNIWLNEGEIPANIAANLTDADGDSLITFHDLNDPSNASFVIDINANGYIDGGDLLADPNWENGVDEDGNGRTDDLVGWDFYDNDNDAGLHLTFDHGTGVAKRIASVGDNGIGRTGVLWSARLMSVRISTNNANRVSGAAALDYAVAEGATLSNNSWGDFTYDQDMFDAIDRARLAGHLFMASAGNDSRDLDVTPRYPAAYNLDNIVSVHAVDSNDQLTPAGSWGQISVDLGAPTDTGANSHATPNVTGVAGLLRTLHPDWTYAQIKDRILAAVDLVPSLAGKSVTGGRLNAALALANTSITVSDPMLVEGAAGTSHMEFTVARFGDTSGTVTLDWMTDNGTASAGSDFVSSSGQLSFAPGGPNTQTISVTIQGDTVQEQNETLFVRLTLVTGDALLADQEAQGTILSDDTPITISDAAVFEGAITPHYRGAFVADGVTSGGHFAPVTFGPDGNLYTAVGTGIGYNTIRRYHGTTGEFLDTFVPQGRINGVRDIEFQNGMLYVGSEYSDEVLRFNATTGEFVDAFVTAGSGGIEGPHGLTFGPDANGDGMPELYVSGRDSFSVVRYDGVTGLPLGTYVTSGSGGLSWPESITFDPSGTYLLVASKGSGEILKYDSQTGAFVGVGASTNLNGPKDVTFGPDGLMYVASGNNDRISRFTASGTYVDDYVPPGSGGMDDPSRLVFGPDGNLYVTATGNDQILRFGTESEAVFAVSLGSTSTLPISMNYSATGGSATPASDFMALSGTITFLPRVTSKHIRIPILDDAAYEGTETFTVNLTDAIAGLIVDGQGVGTILDDELPPTKFYVVDDGAANRTFEYDAAGVAIENYDVESANTAPRGAAATSAGDRVWVGDVNRNVYVYDPAGGLVGSWTAGSLPAKGPQVQGLATDGADVWIVDAKSDKVYQYSGAASRTSGSQNAASSFALNSGNKSPVGIVTDGTYLWVINNAAQDKVFKYTLNGTLLGSWTISGGGGSPTGITLDPADPSHLWIVDNATDRVYQYDNAVGKISGSQGPSGSFALAGTNQNPQGIADPPVVGEVAGAIAAVDAGPPRWDGRLLDVDSRQSWGGTAAVDQLNGQVPGKVNDATWLQQGGRAAARPRQVELAATHSGDALADRADQPSVSDEALLDLMQDGDLFGGARRKRR